MFVPDPEDTDTWLKPLVCRDPSHYPPKVCEWVCPSCGRETRVPQTKATL